MKRAIASVVIILIALLALATAQTVTGTSAGRKVVSRVLPVCPELARKMHLQGVVRVEATVKPNGGVRTTRVLGGNPVLAQAATEAVSRWKFEAASGETTEVVQLTFVAE